MGIQGTISPSLHPLAVRLETVSPDPLNAMGHDPANIRAIADSLAQFRSGKDERSTK